MATDAAMCCCACIGIGLGVFGVLALADPPAGRACTVKANRVGTSQSCCEKGQPGRGLANCQAAVDALEERYQYVIEQLPEEKELASLLSGVNDIGLRNGLEFQRIEWGPTINKPLYYELPINIALTGRYENIGKFAESVAKLSRIVTLTDFDLVLIRQQQNQETLSLKVSASTYRFKAPK